MAYTVFIETLRRNWRSTLFWGGGMALLGAYIMFAIPNVDALEQYARVVESLPPALLQMLGAQDVSAIATPEGFVAFGFFSRVILLIAVYAVIAGLSLTANEEDQGIMDVMLSLPVPRWRIIVEKFAAYIIMVTVIALMSFVGLVIGLRFTSLQVDVAKLFIASINIIPPTLLLIAVTGFIATLVRRRSTALALAAVFVVLSYFINFIGAAASGTLAANLRFLSFFTYYDGEGIIQNGLSLLNVSILIGVSVGLIGGAVWFFNRRDVGI